MPRTAFLQYARVRPALRGVRRSDVRLLIELFCLHINLCILLGDLLVRENREAIFKETTMFQDIKSTHYEHAARQHNDGGVGLFHASLGCSRHWSQPRGTSLLSRLAPLQGISKSYFANKPSLMTPTDADKSVIAISLAFLFQDEPLRNPHKSIYRQSKCSICV